MSGENPRKELEVIKQSADEAREYAESIINTVREPLIILDHDLRVVTASRSFYEFFEVKPEKTLGHHIYDLGNKQWDIPKLRELLETILPKKTTFDNYEVEHDFTTIGRRVMLLNARQIQRVLGRERIILLAIEDITERRQVESVLAEKTADVLSASEEKYRLLVENINDVLYTLDTQGNITYISPVVERFTKYKVRDLIGKPFTSLIYPNDLTGLLDSFNRLASGQLEPWEFRVLDKDGNILFVRSSSRPIYKDGQIVGFTALMVDITERKKVEDVLRKSEEQYRLLADNASDVIWTADMNLNTTYISPSIYAMQGHTPEEVMNLTQEQRYTPESLEKVSKIFMDALANEEAGREQPDNLDIFEAEYIRKDGSTYWTETRASFIRDGAGKAVGILGVTRDITARRQVEEKLVKSYESLQKTLNDAINTMVKMVEMRDPYTAGHQQRVADLATAIAGEMEMDDIRIDQLRTAAVIHDIGKMYIPSDILSKPGKLLDIEFGLIKTHAQSGYDIVNGMDFPGAIAMAVLQHHERLDGSGYPNQLKGEDTLLEAKILAVADVIEAMAAHRPYRPALGIDAALEEISKNSGRLYDPDVVSACLRLFKEKSFIFES